MRIVEKYLLQKRSIICLLIVNLIVNSIINVNQLFINFSRMIRLRIFIVRLRINFDF